MSNVGYTLSHTESRDLSLFLVRSAANSFGVHTFSLLFTRLLLRSAVDNFGVHTFSHEFASVDYVEMYPDL